MANAMYDLGRQAILEGGIAWLTDNIKVTLCDDTDYVKNLVTDNDYADVTAAGRVAESANLGTKTSTLGVADAADFTYSTVTGDQSEELVIWFDTTVEATSLLIANIDTATGLPITPNGNDINVAFDSGANKIFKL